MPQSNKQQHLTEADIALIAAGGALKPEPTAAEIAATEAAAVAAAEALAASQTPEAIAAAAAAAEALAADAAAAELAAKNTKTGAPADVVAYLQAQVKEKDAALLAAAVENQGLTAKVAGIEATHASLLAIAAGAVNTMQVALKGAPTDLKTTDALAVLALHSSVAETFAKTFKVGGVATTSVLGNESAEKKAVAVGPFEAAQIAATRAGSKQA